VARSLYLPKCAPEGHLEVEPRHLSEHIIAITGQISQFRASDRQSRSYPKTDVMSGLATIHPG
jgi:hypothetical protein